MTLTGLGIKKLTPQNQDFNKKKNISLSTLNLR